MGMLTILKKIAVKLERQNDSDFSFPVDMQKKIISSFKEPKDDIERSYYQYCCQMKFNRWFISLFLNMASLPLIIFYLVKGNDSIIEDAHYDAVFISNGIPSHVIPDELKGLFRTWKTVDGQWQYLRNEDRAFLGKVFLKYPFSWHFLLKCIIKIRLYRFVIESYSPQAIVVCGEYSFTSSLLTAFCNQVGIEHVNVMHGEKYYFMRDSFFHFNKCYIWDNFYAELFKSLRADEGQFVVCVPRSMRFSENRNINKEVDYTYYLGGEKDEQLACIASCVGILVANGATVAVRPHPRYSNINKIKHLFELDLVEDCSKIDIEESILRTKNVISCCSTVLNQAYHNQIPVIIDDVSDPPKYKKLNELKYIMLNVKHELLSELIGEIE